MEARQSEGLLQISGNEHQEEDDAEKVLRRKAEEELEMEKVNIDRYFKF